ncbi:MAG: sn-glycerol-1-phosphate dehydrogenase [Anaerolineales bacterium]|nr:sn-glycerol-1-phosphate dehydrogenase [Anaerolineales bacterium]
MRDDFFIYIGKNAADKLIGYCQNHDLDQLMLVADDNTYAAAGRQLSATLKAAGFDVRTSLLKGEEITATEQHFVQVLLDTGREERTFIAVGSGSITDITRFVSFHTRSNFIVFPTAASVDGYTSAGAPSVIAGFKKTVMCQSPLAVFGDTDVLSAAPQKMIASGFGDMLGKYIALADWRLGELFWHEARDEAISRRVRVAVDKCVERVSEIGQASPEGIQALMDGLIESGLCMLDANSSRPASGSEHQISHHLEMKLLWQHKPAVFHGTKVGAASVICAAYYDKLRQMSRSEAAKQLDKAQQPSREQYEREISEAYPGIEDKVLAEQESFMSLSAQGYRELKQKIVDRWDDIQEVAASVPSAQQMAGWLRQVGGETELEALGFTSGEIKEAVEYSHLLRNRFNVNKLWHLCGIEIM